MEFIDRRDKQELSNGAVCVCVLNGSWNKLGMVLAIYSNGRFYDQYATEDDMLPMEQWDITDNVMSYAFTGKTINL